MAASRLLASSVWLVRNGAVRERAHGGDSSVYLQSPEYEIGSLILQISR